MAFKIRPDSRGMDDGGRQKSPNEGYEKITKKKKRKKNPKS
jgi:hypothetical protein